jgi:hypothetical protein
MSVISDVDTAVVERNLGGAYQGASRRENLEKLETLSDGVNNDCQIFWKDLSLIIWGVRETN